MPFLVKGDSLSGGREVCVSANQGVNTVISSLISFPLGETFPSFFRILYRHLYYFLRTSMTFSREFT